MRIVHFKKYAAPLHLSRPSARRVSVQGSRELGVRGRQLKAHLVNTLTYLSTNTKYGNRVLAEMVAINLHTALAEKSFMDASVNPLDFLKALLEGRRCLFERVVQVEASLSVAAMQERADSVDQCARLLVRDLRQRLIVKGLRNDPGQRFFAAFDAMLLQVLNELPVYSAEARSSVPPGRVRVLGTYTLRANQNAWSELLRRTQGSIHATLDIVNDAYQKDPGSFFQYFSVGL